MKLTNGCTIGLEESVSEDVTPSSKDSESFYLFPVLVRAKFRTGSFKIGDWSSRRRHVFRIPARYSEPSELLAYRLICSQFKFEEKLEFQKTSRLQNPS